MKYFIFILILVSGFQGFSQHNSKKYPLIHLTEVTNTPYDTFRIKGTVTDIYICPPCPQGSMCKPCLGDHLTISESNKPEQSLRVFVQKPEDFKMKKSYVFLVRHYNKLHPDEGTALIATVRDKK